MTQVKDPSNIFHETSAIVLTDGTLVDATHPFPVTGSNTDPGTSGQSWGLTVSQGSISGHSFIHKFGAVPVMSTGTFGSIWDKSDTLYPWSAFDTPGIITIQTTLANGSLRTDDDGLSITIQGLDENFLPASDILTIASGVATGTQTFGRVFRAYVSSNGDTNSNEIRMSRGAVEVARISIGKAQTLMSVYTIPAGYTGYLMDLSSTTQYNGDATVEIYSKVYGEPAFRIKDSFEVSGVGGPYNISYNFPEKYIEKSDIDLRAITRTNNARVSASFSFLLVAN